MRDISLTFGSLNHENVTGILINILGSICFDGKWKAFFVFLCNQNRIGNICYEMYFVKPTKHDFLSGKDFIFCNLSLCSSFYY